MINMCVNNAINNLSFTVIDNNITEGVMTEREIGEINSFEAMPTTLFNDDYQDIIKHWMNTNNQDAISKLKYVLELGGLDSDRLI